jgi:serine phosphatase RsbU (regulator of sigma subunit)
VKDGCWIGIGDVAGHGLVAGLVMLQTQSALKALVLQDPNRRPGDALADVNDVLFGNVRRRLGHDEHMTMSLVRYHNDGRIVVAGAHQSIIICRASTRTCERHAPQGTWLGLVDDIRPFTEERTFHLEQGDLLVLFTDGLTEAMNAQGEQFGLDRLCMEVERAQVVPPSSIRDRLLTAVNTWAKARLDDDLTLLVLRQEAPTVRRAEPVRAAVALES